MMKTYSALLIYGLCCGLLWGCGTSSPESNEPWELTDAQVKPNPEPFIPKDGQPLYFPPGTMPWQPKDTPIIVHTGLGHPASEGTIRSAAQANVGLSIFSSFRINEHPILPSDSTERTWIALDLEELRFRGALHFFELVAGKQDHIPSGQQGSFIWTPAPGVVFHAAHGTDFIIYIEQLPGPRVRPGYDEGTTKLDPPTVPSPWVELATRCLNIRCPLDIFVWKPEAERFFVLKGYYIYVGSDPEGTVFPESFVGDFRDLP